MKNKQQYPHPFQHNFTNKISFKGNIYLMRMVERNKVYIYIRRVPSSLVWYEKPNRHIT